MREKLQIVWARASACLLVSIVTFVGGGVLLFGAVQEIYGDYSDTCRAAGATCHDPRGWVVIALTVAGFGLFALGAATWMRAFYLVDQVRRRRAAV
jgi:hypothetical protein